MKEIIDNLLALEKLLLNVEPLSLDVESKTNDLRGRVPKPILAHFDRLIAQGKTGVAAVRHGVCCGCHLKLCSGTAALMSHETDIHICDNCGRYLFLAAEAEPVQIAVEPPKKPKRARKPRPALATA